MARVAVIVALVAAMVFSATIIDAAASPKLARIRANAKAKAKVRTKSVSYDAITQLTCSTDSDYLSTWIAAGEVTKSTGEMMAWQAAESSTDTIKEIHTLAGGEEGVTSGRTWVFSGADWDGFSDWVSNLSDDDLSTYADVDTDAMTVSWTISLPSSDEPSDDDCTSYATYLADSDLASALVVASNYYEQDIDIDEDSTAYASLLSLSESATLKAERFDSSCIGWKFFSYYDSPTDFSTSSTSASSTTPAFSD